MKGQDSNLVIKILRDCKGCQVRQLVCDLVLCLHPIYCSLSNQVACQGPMQFGPQQCSRTLGQQSGQCMAPSSGRNVFCFHLVNTRVCMSAWVYRCAKQAEVNLNRVLQLLWKQGFLLNHQVLGILLSLPSQSWDHKYASSHPGFSHGFWRVSAESSGSQGRHWAS